MLSRLHWRRIPRGVWMLGLVSLFMDVSSEMMHALLPIFIIREIGAGPLALGLLEGTAEAATSITKIFSGAISDYLGKRKLLAVIGYAMAAFTKPLFPLADSFGLVASARFLDRIGKGIRGAPRDALLTELSPVDLRGACFGLRQSMDTIGAFIGPLLAIGLMLATGDRIRTVLWFGTAPALLAVACLVFGVKEPDADPARPANSRRITWRELRRFGAPYWWVLIIGCLVTVARLGDAFLILRGATAGLSAAWVPATFVAMNFVYALAAYPAGVWSDHRNRHLMLIFGLLALLASDLVLAAARSATWFFLGIALWGIHLALTQGILATLVADTCPVDRRGTAFGVFHLATGLMLLAGGALAGTMWEFFGPAATFGVSGGLAAIATWIVVLRHRRSSLTSLPRLA